MGSSRKIADGVLWTTIVNVVGGLYGFISVPILLAYFGRADYGLIGLAMSVNVYLRLMDLGLSSTNVRFFSNWITQGERGKVGRLFGTSLSFYGAIGLTNALILVGMSFACSHIFNLEPWQEPIMRNLFYILAISAFVSWFTSCFDQLIKAHEYVGWTQKMMLLPKLMQIVVLILTVTLHFSIELYYMLTAFSMFIIIPLMVRKIRAICPYVSFLPHFDKATFKEILPYSLNIFSFGIFQFSVNYLRPVFLGVRGTTEMVADYTILNNIITIVLLLGGTFSAVLLPSATKAVTLHNREAQDRVAYAGTRYVTIALCFCCFGMISVSAEVITLYVGAEYLGLQWWLVLWLLTTLTAHNQAISSLILAGADIRAITYNTIASSIIGLLVCWCLIPTLGLGATVVGYGIYGLAQISFYYVYYWPRKMGINARRVFFRSFIPYTLVGLVLSLLLVSYPLNISPWIALLAKGAAFALTYTASVFLLMTPDDRTFIKSLLLKRNAAQ